MRTLIALSPLIAVAALTLMSASQDPEAKQVDPVTVILVRHAETAGDTSGGGDANPGLSEEGRVRAARLAEMFEHAGVTHAFASEFNRTQETLAPLGKAAGVDVISISTREIESQLKALRDLAPGSVAIVCGHSNTIPTFAKELGAKPQRLESHPRYGGLIPHGDYGRIYIVTLPGVNGARSHSLELTY
ncbi:MAG: histidine phosphatase family protein [Planctomycetes bacterium]|nr:histidine phosphatase family protein [Planctomycetota bacterium]